MVSLVNFKSVDDDLQQQQRRPSLTVASCAASQPQDRGTNNFHEQQSSLNQVLIVQEQSPQPKLVVDTRTQQQQQHETEFDQDQSANRMQNLKLVISNPSSYNDSSCNQNAPNQQNLKPAKGMFCPVAPLSAFVAPEKPTAMQISVGASTCETMTNFVVTWRNLRFAIEPKWHQRLASAGSLTANFRSRQQTVASNTTTTTLAIECGLDSSGHGPNGIPHHLQPICNETHQQPPETKVVLDLLDGSFKSGELTAILGPSGE